MKDFDKIDIGDVLLPRHHYEYYWVTGSNNTAHFVCETHTINFHTDWYFPKDWLKEQSNEVYLSKALGVLVKKYVA